MCKRHFFGSILKELSINTSLKVKKMYPLNNAMLSFSDGSIWEYHMKKIKQQLKELKCTYMLQWGPIFLKICQKWNMR